MFDEGINVLGYSFLALCLFAAVSDFIRMRIPNWVNCAIFGVALVTGIALAATGIVSWTVFAWHLFLALIGLVVGFALFALRVVGGGDAKFFPGALMWVGPAGSLYFLIYMSLISGVLAIFALSWRFIAAFSDTLTGLSRYVKSLSREGGIPFGIAIAAGIFMAGVHSPFQTFDLAGHSAETDQVQAVQTDGKSKNNNSVIDG